MKKTIISHPEFIEGLVKPIREVITTKQIRDSKSGAFLFIVFES